MTTGRINQVASVRRRARRRVAGKRVPPPQRRAPPAPSRRKGRGRMRLERTRRTVAARRTRRLRPPVRHDHNLPAPSSTGPRSGTGRAGGKSSQVRNRAIVAQGEDPRPPVTLRPPRKETKRIPTIRDPRGSIEAMSTVANGHSPTDRTCAGRREGDRAWGRRRRPARATPPLPATSPGGEEARRGVARDRAPRRNRTCQPAPADVTRSRMHLCSRGLDDGPAGTGRRRRTRADHHSSGDPPRRLTPAECNCCTGPLAGADASSAEARAPGRHRPAGTGRAARHDGTVRAGGSRGGPDRPRSTQVGTGAPFPPTVAVAARRRVGDRLTLPPRPARFAVGPPHGFPRMPPQTGGSPVERRQDPAPPDCTAVLATEGEAALPRTGADLEQERHRHT